MWGILWVERHLDASATSPSTAAVGSDDLVGASGAAAVHDIEALFVVSFCCVVWERILTYKKSRNEEEDGG